MATKVKPRSFVLHQLMQNPEITWQEVEKKWRHKPVFDSLIFYSTRYSLAKRLGLKSLSKLPRLQDGSIDPVGMITQRFHNHRKVRSFKQIALSMIVFGIVLNQKMYDEAVQRFEQTKHKVAQPKKVQLAADSPDLNQNNGPRARKFSAQSRKSKKVATLNDDTSNQKVLVRLELGLDELISDAKQNGLVDVALLMRRVRNHLIVQQAKN